MPNHIISGRDPIPEMLWLMVGGNILSPPPTWDRFLLMAGERVKVEREAKAEEKEFKEAKKQAMAELKAQEKATKEAFKGGLVAWRKRKHEAKTNSEGEDEERSSRENRQPENNSGGDHDGTEICG
ncbi:uncharacterized protein GLRG_03851 [Colletotrichum graminicola M1.001]|uniref:Uncharacterized protein n=1 Tax=Colletotrichum graminicola (strain M1.001 / M2 / FGSC 10212) TaxID=645133 RepID=E3QDK2_COLGM|nr:uncharacterized protein GLRG_03851 [Colletotrichum graminicola M1.001]EFQ28707.1 hypothetical protein GLRG_03851 [Colletotrichum graminicola M1.001]